MKGKFLKLFACCIPVKGAARSLICDMQRSRYHFIPNSLYDLLQAADSIPADELVKDLSGEDLVTWEEYVQFLTANELIFFTDTPDLFPAISETMVVPETINNALLDRDDQSAYDIPTIIHQLDLLGCKALQFRFFGKPGKAEINAALTTLHNTSFNSTEVVLRIHDGLGIPELEDIIKENRRLAAIYAFNAGEDEVLDIKSNVMKKIFLVNQELQGPQNCGCISPSYFSMDIQHVMEAKKFNTCLNKKISIDSRGYIRNCPSMQEEFGRSDDTDLLAAVKLARFQRLWFINKDQIEVCKDCEFRYMCSDCRAYTEKGELSKPQKCNYDPYTAVWA